MTRWRTALLATTLAVGPLAAHAQPAPPVQGPNVSFGAGYNLLQDLYDHPRLSPYTLPATRYRFRAPTWCSSTGTVLT